MKKIFIVSVFLTMINFCYSQSIEIAWEKSYGGSQFENGYNIESTSDGGYIFAAYTSSIDGNVETNYGLYDVWVVKVDINGEIEWEKNYGGTGTERAPLYAEGRIEIRTLNDGGYVVGASTSSSDGDVGENHGNFDYWVFKLNSVGEIEWEKTFENEDEEILFTIQLTSDNGMVIIGRYYGVSSNGIDVKMIKLNSLGEFEWLRSFEDSNYDEFRAMKPTIDGGYIMAGISGIYLDLTLRKLNEEGVVEWEQVFPSENNIITEVHSIQQTLDNGFILAGSTGELSNPTSLDVWVAKFDFAGNLVWERTYGGSNFDIANFINLDSSGGYIFVGESRSNDGDLTNHYGSADFGDAWVVSIDELGEIIWQKSFGGSDYDHAESFLELDNDGLLVIGSTSSNDGDVNFNHGGSDVWLFKLDISLSLNEYTSNDVKVYPNPVDDILFLTEKIYGIKIYSISGEIVQFFDSSDKINISELKEGIYFLQGNTFEGKTITKKIIKNK